MITLPNCLTLLCQHRSFHFRLHDVPTQCPGTVQSGPPFGSKTAFSSPQMAPAGGQLTRLAPANTENGHTSGIWLQLPNTAVTRNNPHRPVYTICVHQKNRLSKASTANQCTTDAVAGRAGCRRNRQGPSAQAHTRMYGRQPLHVLRVR